MKIFAALISGVAAVREHSTISAEVVLGDQHWKLDTELGAGIDRHMHKDHKAIIKQHHADQEADPTARYVPNLADCMRAGHHVNALFFDNEDHLEAIIHPLHQRSKDTLDAYCPRAIRYAALDHAQQQEMVHFEAMRPIWGFPESFAKSHLHLDAHQQAAALMQEKTNTKLHKLAKTRQWLHRAEAGDVQELQVEKLISAPFMCALVSATQYLTAETEAMNAMGTLTPLKNPYQADEILTLSAAYSTLQKKFGCGEIWATVANKTKQEAAEIVDNALNEIPNMYLSMLLGECSDTCNSETLGGSGGWSASTPKACELSQCLTTIQANNTYALMMNLGRLQASQMFRSTNDDTQQAFLPWWIWLIIGLIIALFVGMIVWFVTREGKDEDEEGEVLDGEVAEGEGEGEGEDAGEYYEETAEQGEPVYYEEQDAEDGGVPVS